jgi:hypothetical protein
VLDVAHGSAPDLPPRVRQQVWHQAVAAAAGTRARGRSGYRVSVDAPAGVITRVFLQPVV